MQDRWLAIEIPAADEIGDDGDGSGWGRGAAVAVQERTGFGEVGDVVATAPVESDAAAGAVVSDEVGAIPVDAGAALDEGESPGPASPFDAPMLLVFDCAPDDRSRRARRIVAAVAALAVIAGLIAAGVGIGVLGFGARSAAADLDVAGAAVAAVASVAGEVVESGADPQVLLDRLDAIGGDLNRASDDLDAARRLAVILMGAGAVGAVLGGLGVVAAGRTGRGLLLSRL